MMRTDYEIERDYLRMLQERDAWKRLVHDAERAIGMQSLAGTPEARSLVEQCHELRTKLNQLETLIKTIKTYAADSLSGPITGPDDRKWYRDSLVGVLSVIEASGK